MIPKCELTKAGAALLAKVPAGEYVPVTRWQIGTKALPGGSLLENVERVQQPLKYLPIASVENKGPRAVVMGQFINRDMEAFSFEELALLATDPDKGEIILAYGNGYGSGEEIQAGTVQLREFQFGVELIFSNKANITAVVDSSMVFIPLEQKSAPGGVAPLGPDGLVPEEFLPPLGGVNGTVVQKYNVAGGA